MTAPTVTHPSQVTRAHLELLRDRPEAKQMVEQILRLMDRQGWSVAMALSHLGPANGADETVVTLLEGVPVGVSESGELPDNLRDAYLARLNATRRAQAEAIRDGVLDPNKGHGVPMGMDHVPPTFGAELFGINYATVNDYLDNQVSRATLGTTTRSPATSGSDARLP